MTRYLHHAHGLGYKCDMKTATPNKPEPKRRVWGRHKAYTNYDWARDLAKLNGMDENPAVLRAGIAELRRMIGPR